MSKGKFALGAFIGTAIGVVTGLLVAPKSGKETRDELKIKADKAKNEAAKKAKCIISETSEMAEDAKAKAMDIADKVKSEASDLKVRSERAVEAAKKEFSDKK
jgi:gas vesicle protein